MTAHIPVAIIGAGQAGLSVSWYLSRAGIDHVVLEAKTPAHAWADSRWDRFTLVTPNWHCRLPGYSYAGPDPDGFMTRDEVVDWLADMNYYDMPVTEHPLREGVRDNSRRRISRYSQMKPTRMPSSSSP